ncbi:MAG: MltA domain-containing protein [Desulforhopalus sp.]|nr:MltA domain-containing protein [Desulforhopalus sp.]
MTEPIGRGTLILVSTCLVVGVFLFFHREPWLPVHIISPGKGPAFSDDGDLLSLRAAVEKQLHWLESKPVGTTVQLGDEEIPVTLLHLSLSHLSTFLHSSPTPRQLAAFLHDNYDVFQAGGRKEKRGRELLVTAYYEPVFNGDLQKTDTARWPIYQLPKKMTPGTKHGWNRREIELFGRLKGQELAWLNDPFDAYLLHVQGSGKIRRPDGSIFTVRYAGNNAMEYMSLGKLFVDEKILPLEKVNIPAMRKWLTEHPEEQQRMFFHNPRYIFFKKGTPGNPEGSNGVKLTPGRSIAIDPDILPTGSMGLIKTRMPRVQNSRLNGWYETSRLVFPQDSGAAIKGAGRVDLFLGSGDVAEKTAQIMKEPGKLYFLFWRDKENFEEK